MIVDKMKKRPPTAKNIKSKIDIPVGKWVKCDKCKEIVYKETVRENMSICPNCGAYFRMHINKRLETILDEGSYKKFDLNIDNVNPLNLDGYEQKIKTLRAKTGIQEAVSAGTGKINGEDVVICVMDSGFLMGSMGSVVGEKITYSMEKAIELGIPFIIFCTSGGARMQEGIISLMQMAKTTAAVAKLNTLPPVGRSSILMQRTKVDLPAPERPIIPKISPALMLRLVLCRAWISPALL